MSSLPTLFGQPAPQQMTIGEPQAPTHDLNDVYPTDGWFVVGAEFHDSAVLRQRVAAGEVIYLCCLCWPVVLGNEFEIFPSLSAADGRYFDKHNRVLDKTPPLRAKESISWTQSCCLASSMRPVEFNLNLLRPVTPNELPFLKLVRPVGRTCCCFDLPEEGKPRMMVEEASGKSVGEVFDESGCGLSDMRIRILDHESGQELRLSGSMCQPALVLSGGLCTLRGLCPTTNCGSCRKADFMVERMEPNGTVQPLGKVVKVRPHINEICGSCCRASCDRDQYELQFKDGGFTDSSRVMLISSVVFADTRHFSFCPNATEFNWACCCA